MSALWSLAPMATLSHRALRELILHYGSGPDLFYTEMIGAAAYLNGGPFERYYDDAGPCPERVVFQLVGDDIDEMTRVAAKLSSKDCAGIDLNMGCSAPEIIRAGSGMAWFRTPGRAQRLVSSVRAVTGKRLSVKLRAGWERDTDALVSFCRGLVDAGADALTLHGRLATQKFKGKADWSLVALLQDALPATPIAGNGDIEDVQGLIARSRATPGGVMLGRAAVKTPWIFAAGRGQLEPGAVVDLEECANLFLDLAARWQPREFLPTRLKRFFFYFLDNLRWAHHVKTLVNRAIAEGGDYSQVARVLAAHFAENGEERFVTIPGPF